MVHAYIQAEYLRNLDVYDPKQVLDFLRGFLGLPHTRG